LELLETLAVEMQFKLCVFIGSHGPAGTMLKQIVAEETTEVSGRVGNFHGMRVLVAGSMDYNRDVVKAFNSEHGIPKAYHGGLWETALNYAIKPEYFHPEYLDETKYPQHYGPLMADDDGTHRRPSKHEFSQFSPEFAKELRDTTVRCLVEDVQKNYAEILQEETK
jgi:creatinine amidohydrolase/Fe(II)-dependent formamide hydrolase-like protein